MLYINIFNGYSSFQHTNGSASLSMYILAMLDVLWCIHLYVVRVKHNMLTCVNFEMMHKVFGHDIGTMQYTKFTRQSMAVDYWQNGEKFSHIFQLNWNLHTFIELTLKKFLSVYRQIPDDMPSSRRYQPDMGMFPGF